jgi:ribosomal protein S6--L-glutamate ligase
MRRVTPPRSPQPVTPIASRRRPRRGDAGPRPAIWLLSDRRYLGQRMPSALADWLRGAGRPPRVVVADGDAAWAGLRAGDLVVARSRHPRALGLLDEAEARGARTLISPETMDRVRDKARCTLALGRRGLPVPRMLLTGRPEELGGLPEDAFPLVVKPVHGDNARGVRVVASRDELARLRWGDEPLLAQAYVEAGGFDVKLYVAGEHVWATRRRSPLHPSAEPPRRVPVTPALRRIAEGCRAEFGLPLFGVDVLQSADGPAIVDVNEFPNYTGVAAAPAAIGRLLLGAAGDHRAWAATA